MSKQVQLKSIIDKLRGDLPELKGALVASSDGMAIAQSITDGDAQRMAAMTATAVGLGKRITETIGAGGLSETSVKGENGQMFLYQAGKGVLAVITNGSANIGLINLEARDAAEQIAAVL